MGNNCSCSIDVKINLEGVEIAGNNNNLSLPISESSIIVFFIDSNSCVESGIGKRYVISHHLFFKINELNLNNLNRFASFGPFEVNNEETIAELSDD